MSVPFVDLRRLHAEDREQLLAAFTRVLDSGSFVQGCEVAAFEKEFAPIAGTKHVVALNSGTAALHLALLGMDIGPGDEVITVANTFFATAEAISLVGATPIFADIAAGSFQVDPADVERRISSRTRAIIAVHLYGEMGPMPELTAIARLHNLRLIEDACQAHGATLDGGPAGAWSDAACFSFYPTKNLGGIGEGGALVTDDADIARKARELRDHGQERKHSHASIGLNYRMAELQAAGLRVVLPRLGEGNAQRIAAAARYAQGLLGSDVTLPAMPGDGSHVYHLFVIRTAERDALAAHLREAGVATAVHYPVAIHQQPAYASSGQGGGGLPRTEAAVAEILSLPMHPHITPAEVDEVCDAIRAFERNRDSVRGALVEVA